MPAATWTVHAAAAPSFLVRHDPRRAAAYGGPDLSFGVAPALARNLRGDALRRTIPDTRRTLDCENRVPSDARHPLARSSDRLHEPAAPLRAAARPPCPRRAVSGRQRSPCRFPEVQR